jgi:predicted NUDIX family NTP pyrophosphohydrolase
MVATSAGLLLWRSNAGELEVLIVHPGGPYWAKKDDGAWSLPKGEYEPGSEDGRDAARREFHEELGQEAPVGELVELGQTRLKSGKTISAWAIEGNLDADAITSNTFEIEWPPRSGRNQHFPEVDRALWCTTAIARSKLNPAQRVFVDRVSDLLNS